MLKGISNKAHTLHKVSAQDIDCWIETRLQTLTARHADHGFIEIDSIEFQQLEHFRTLLSKLALATHLNSPEVLDSLERRRKLSSKLQAKNMTTGVLSFTPEPC
ncbi:MULTISPECIES: hypothetical protein [Pseudomonas putida group]|uniref:hypothetical protein n=1 Tax=Pseudomonas putida group TaxID=136845 RepID=UPI00111BE607|nr:MULTISPECIES: hypothetical protein [Pseudomonas putida group]MEC4024883.1 hypothetical protein [Pseudomonas fulva]